MSKNETILKYLSDMAASEYQLAQALKAQQNDSEFGEFPQATLLVNKIRATAEQHVEGLEKLAHSLDGEARSSFKESVTVITGTALGAVSHLRSHHVSKMLRDDHVQLSMNSIGYTMLHTTGLALSEPAVASLALSYLKDTAKLIMELSHECIPVVVGELRKTEDDVLDMAQTAQEDVRSAWNS